MKSIAALLLLVVAILCFGFGRDAGRMGAKPPSPIGRACVGNDPCNACKNCKGCKYCKKDGGTCGTCKPTTKPR